MRARKYLLALLILLIFGSNAFAQEKKWSDAGEVSYIDTGGNSKLTTLSVKNLVKHRFSEQFEGSWKFDILYGKSNDVTNSESYLSVEFLNDFSNANKYNIGSVTAIISSLNDHLSLKSSYEVKYNNKPVPSTLDKTDTMVALTLLINYN